MGLRILYVSMENGILGSLAVLEHKLGELDGHKEVNIIEHR